MGYLSPFKYAPLKKLFKRETVGESILPYPNSL